MKKTATIFLMAGSIFGLSAFTEVKEMADEKWTLVNNKAEKLDSVLNFEMKKVEHLDSTINKELAKIIKLNTVIEMESLRLDSLLDNF